MSRNNRKDREKGLKGSGLTPEQEILQKARVLKIKQKKEAMVQINTILGKAGLRLRVEHQIVIEEKRR